MKKEGKTFWNFIISLKLRSNNTSCFFEPLYNIHVWMLDIGMYILWLTVITTVVDDEGILYGGNIKNNCASFHSPCLKMRLTDSSSWE